MPNTSSRPVEEATANPGEFRITSDDYGTWTEIVRQVGRLGFDRALQVLKATAK